VLFAEEGIDDIPRVTMKTVEHLGIEGRHPLRGLEQTLSVRVLAKRLDDLTHRLFDATPVDRGLDVAHPRRK
jgi:hypothetical protein